MDDDFREVTLCKPAVYGLYKIVQRSIRRFADGDNRVSC